LLVLDELGTWFNSRSWGDKERGAVLGWFLHARKWGWDVLFIVQDIGVVDRQLRDTLAEHLVICKRLDRVRVPVVGGLLGLFGITSRLPKLHVGIVRYGTSANSMVVDRWWYSGRDLYPAYDTRQVFRDDVELVDGRLVDMRASFTELSPYLRFGRYSVRLTRVDYLSIFFVWVMVLLFYPRAILRAWSHLGSVAERFRVRRSVALQRARTRRASGGCVRIVYRAAYQRYGRCVVPLRKAAEWCDKRLDLS